VQGSQHYIDGGFTVGTGGRSGPVYDPSRGETIYQCSYADRATLDNAASIAAVAGRKWARQSQARRLQTIFAMREAVIREKDELARLIGLENGKTIEDAMGEIGRAIEALEFATNAPQVTKGEYSVNVGGGIDTFSIRQPVGVVGCIAPFNFPAMVPLMMGAMAIATGNAVIIKPSERVPGASAFIAELWQRAGLPNGVWNVVNGDAEVVDAMLENPEIGAISFVGSTRVGEYIYRKGSSHDKRVAAYTGGKNHMIVMPDADLKAAAAAFVSAAYGSASQRCMAVSLLLAVGEETAQAMRELIVPLVNKLRVGSYDDKSADFGPVVTAAARKSVEDAIQMAIDEGGELIVDGRNPVVAGKAGGFFVGASLVDRVTTDMQLWREEIFGPVRGIMRLQSLDEAIDVVNRHEYGNGAVIFTRSGQSASRFYTEVEAGMLGVNVPIPVPVGHHNFGGLRRSKFGDAHMFGPDAARFYTKMKTISQRWPDPAAGDASFSMAFPGNS
jgi:malonate-semialdehyde dehydrogenase (acetylating)/methylmalonate-semialdehyde dehydrogenase